MRKSFKDETGKRYGRWMVVSISDQRYSTNKGKVKFNCVCDCGTKRVVAGFLLRNDQSTSCGCFNREISRAQTPHNKTHGDSGSPIYNVWLLMIKRCGSRKSKEYAMWGGRGITVCDRWLRSYENFRSDMGPRPHSSTIERVDNDGPYSPENCVWASRREQNGNKRNNVRLTFYGVIKTVSQWIAGTSLTTTLVRERLGSGWNQVDAVTLPANHPRPKRSKEVSHA